MGDATSRLLTSLIGGFTLLVGTVLLYVTVSGVRWHVLTSSYQLFLLGMSAGGLLTATLVLWQHLREEQGSAGLHVVVLAGMLMTGATQAFFFRMLGGDRYLVRLMELLNQLKESSG